jgi:type VI secretion system secreted protein VgrG
VPFDLPANKTQSGMKSRSSMRGTDSHYNELVFEDKKDAEFVRFHAEKDLNSTIEDAEKRIIKGKNKAEEGETTRETIIERGDDVLYVKGDHKTTIDGDQELTIKKSQTVDVGSVISVTAGEKMILKVGQSTITLTPTAIEINTPNFKTKSMFTSINADVEIAEKAALIKLN